MVSFIYRLLSRLKKQDEISQDMLRTFEEARAEARSAGWWRYVQFAIREIVGLFEIPSRGVWWLRAAGWSIAGLAAGWLASYLLPARYTSEAELRLAPQMVSQELLPRGGLSVDGLLETQTPVLLSRAVIMHIVNTFELYRNLRSRKRMEEIVEEFRKSTHIERAGANVIRVAFTYGDFPSYDGQRAQAQKVAMELVSRMIDESIREQASRVFATQRFFKDRADRLAEAWSQLNKSVDSTSPTNPQYASLVRSRDQKRKELDLAEQKRAEAEELAQLAGRKLDRTLELFDPATLPEEPDTPPITIRLAGLGCGLGIWLLTALWRGLRRPAPELVPESA